mmetsp:Transcript_87107/g.247189  ORF Transcript_87107/g.247189 Transcript_87107/m.247189 type:complete len:209 (+) Transcript_87107:136-762(+)
MAQSSSTASIADKLLKLSKAKEEGVITQADFEVHRDALMTEARGGPAAPPIPSASLSEPPPPAPAAQAVPVAAPHAAIVVATNQPAQQVCFPGLPGALVAPRPPPHASFTRPRPPLPQGDARRASEQCCRRAAPECEHGPGSARALVGSSRHASAAVWLLPKPWSMPHDVFLLSGDTGSALLSCGRTHVVQEDRRDFIRRPCLHSIRF